MSTQVKLKTFNWTSTISGSEETGSIEGHSLKDALISSFKEKGEAASVKLTKLPYLLLQMGIIEKTSSSETLKEVKGFDLEKVKSRITDSQYGLLAEYALYLTESGKIKVSEVN
jgi:hypothetical protein